MQVQRPGGWCASPPKSPCIPLYERGRRRACRPAQDQLVAAQGPLLAGRAFILSAKASNQRHEYPPFVKGGEGGFLQTLGQSEPITLLCRRRRAPCFVGGRRASGICRSNGPEGGAPVRRNPPVSPFTKGGDDGPARPLRTG